MIAATANDDAEKPFAVFMVAIWHGMADGGYPIMAYYNPVVANMTASHG
jgi:hypothetical protein